ncbi:MAG: helix-turn-helix domain-containing protein, partial [Betaproteobacteria bacterium]|nr:helix-turn-helix domain-containing protein [Betaproteobacteria bacterium]
MSEMLEGRPEEAPAQAPTPAAEEGVGQALAQARRALGLSLDDVAQQLKYGARQIEALEQGRFDSLHGATFARGMVRSYARLLKLDPEPLLERIADGGTRPDALGAALSSRRPIPFSDTSRRSNVTYVVLSLVTLAVGAVVALQWHLERSAQRSRSTFVAAPQAPLDPARTRASAAAPGAPARGPDAVAPSAASPGGSPAAESKPAVAPEGKSAPQPLAAAP